MENKHVTEENIQSFVLKEIVDKNSQIHLSQCDDCKAKYNTYKALISTIKTLQSETFSFDVTAIVMQKILATETKKTTKNNSLLYAIVGLFCIGIFTVLFPYLKTSLLYFQKLSVFENGLIFITAFGITIYLLNDIFRNHRKNELLLFK